MFEKGFDLRGLLTSERCDEIKEEIIFMFEECNIDTFPIDCFEIAQKLYYVLRPYSTLSQENRTKSLRIDKDGYSKVEINPVTGMHEYVIYYNDETSNYGRLRWTIFHEIGHIYLGHHDNPDDSHRDIEEAEANFFAKYAITPPPLVNATNCESPGDLMETFHVSYDAACNSFNYFQKWLHYGPIDYVDFELHLLQMFHMIAA